MKILFAVPNLWDGGAQRVISVIASELAERGHDVSILLFHRHEKEYAIHPKVNLISLRNSYKEYNQMAPIARLAFIRRYLKEFQPDVAVGFLAGGYAVYLASIGMQFPKIASARVDPKLLLEGKGISAAVNRFWFKHADAVVLQTNRQKEHAKNTKWKHKVVIANPISDAALCCPLHDYDRPCRRIVMVGRLALQKNYAMMLRAMQRIHEQYPDMILDIYGTGQLENDLLQQIREKNLEQCVTLRGWTSNSLGEYSKSDIYVMTSDYEGMPNALMEALAMGLPCISTDCDTGPEDLITDGENGFLIDVNDDVALASRILEIAAMLPEQRAAIGQRAHETLASKFNCHAITGQWENLFRELRKKHEGHSTW